MERAWWTWYIASMIGFLLTILLVTSCSTTGEPSYNPELGPGCPDVTIENRSGIPIDDNDRATAKSASTRCVKYYPRSPCLITFTKMAPQTYRAICGAER
jgi:hypothetical protein